MVRAFFMLDANGNPVVDPTTGKAVAAGPVTVALSSSNPGSGTPCLPTLQPQQCTSGTIQVSFAGGVDTVAASFDAGTPGSTLILATEPAGFSVPSDNSNTLPVTVQSGSIKPNGATVGFGFETTTNFNLAGGPVNPPDPRGQPFLITSSDPSKLLFSTTGTDAGSASITVFVPANRSNSPDYFVYGLANTGTVGYTVCEQVDPNTPQCMSGADFAPATGNIALARSGFVLQTPAGVADGTRPFTTTTSSGDSQLTVIAGLLDASGNYTGTSQAIAGGRTVSVNVTSSNTAVGTITTSPVTISTGNNIATTSFHPVANGSTTVSLSTPAGFVASTNGSTPVNVTTPSLLIFGGSVIGNKLEQSASILISAPAPAGGLPVAISVVSGPATVSNSPTAVGGASTVVTIPAGASSALYYIQGTANSGTVVIQASAPGFTSSPQQSDTVAPSAIVIGGPGGFGFAYQVSLSGGPAPVTIGTAVLDPSGNAVDTSQLLAPGQSLTVSVGNSNTGVATFPATVTFAGGNATVTANITPKTTGSTVLSVAQPAGFTAPATGPGDFSKLTVNVGP